jgi:hypothetical protein
MCKHVDSQEELVLPLLGPDAVGSGEPLARHIDHRDLRLGLALHHPDYRDSLESKAWISVSPQQDLFFTRYIGRCGFE